MTCIVPTRYVCPVRHSTESSRTALPGIIPGHAYSVVEMSEEFNLSKMGLKSYMGKPTLRLIRLLNPWGELIRPIRSYLPMICAVLSQGLTVPGVELYRGVLCSAGTELSYGGTISA